MAATQDLISMKIKINWLILSEKKTAHIEFGLNLDEDLTYSSSSHDVMLLLSLT
jgi:hypothetical protein